MREEDPVTATRMECAKVIASTGGLLVICLMVKIFLIDPSPIMIGLAGLGIATIAVTALLCRAITARGDW